MSWFLLEPRGKDRYLISSLMPLFWILGLFFAKNQVGENSEGALRGSAFGVFFFLFFDWDDGLPDHLGVDLRRSFCEMVPGYNCGDLFFHHHHPVFWVGPASDFRGRVGRMVLWLGALLFQAKVCLKPQSQC